MIGIVLSGRDELKQFAREKSLDGVQLVCKEDFPEHLIPLQGAPFAVALSTDGTVAAHGKPKTLTHLREMAYAAEHMAELATTHSVRSHDWGDSIPYWDAAALT